MNQEKERYLSEMNKVDQVTSAPEKEEEMVFDLSLEEKQQLEASFATLRNMQSVQSPEELRAAWDLFLKLTNKSARLELGAKRREMNEVRLTAEQAEHDPDYNRNLKRIAELEERIKPKNFI